jgi:hypothetical protein
MVDGELAAQCEKLGRDSGRRAVVHAPAIARNQGAALVEASPHACEIRASRP